MNASMRRAGLGILALFVAVAAQLTYLQVLRADDLKNDPGNVRVFLRDVNRARGPILTSDGAIVADSVPSKGEIEQQRRYGLGALFGHASGFQSIVFGNSGVERTYNDELVGRDIDLQLDDLSDLLSDEEVTGTVVLSLSKAAQEAARAALGDQRGTIVVLEPRTGAIVAMYSNPSYDPTPLAAHDVDDVRAAYSFLQAAPDNPMLARAWREIYPSGSTFKIVTAALSLEAGITTPDRVFPTISELPLPLTDRTISNFGGDECGGTFVESFVHSCNTTFAQLGLELGEQLASGIEHFGINTSPPPTDLDPRVTRSRGPQRGSFRRNQPLFAQAAIGQAEIALTPLEMAMIVAAVANDGVVMVPHVGAEIRNADGVTVRRIDAREWRTAMEPVTADVLTDMMRQVVERGTGTGAQIPGIAVAGKTGTAQVPGQDPHAWFVGFAPADNPAYAIAVLVEHGGSMGSEATGGRVAAPMARAVLSTLLGASPQGQP